MGNCGRLSRRQLPVKAGDWIVPAAETRLAASLPRELG